MRISMPPTFNFGSGAKAAPSTSGAPDLSMITESSFLDNSGFAPLQFADEPPGGGNYLSTGEYIFDFVRGSGQKIV